MNLKLEFQFSKAEILKEVDELKKQIDAMRPLPEDVEGRVMQKLRLDWNYHSNAIEGNKLSYGETVAFLMEGITAKGKPLKDHLDIRGHNEAINFLLEIVKETRPISEADIRALHKMILVEPYDSPAQTPNGLPTTKRITLGEYKTSPNHVKTATGEIHYYATPEETPAKMQELMQWLEEVERYDNIHPVVIAAFFHHKFVEIHPFDDGNGRMSRILMNLILMQYGYPPVIVKMDDRINYYSLLSRADNGDSWPFVEYIAELLNVSLRIYLNAAVGEDIDEEDDIDKEIALYKIELQTKLLPKKKADREDIYNVILDVIFPLIKKLLKKVVFFEEFFESINSSLDVEINRNIDQIPQYKIFENVEQLIIANKTIESVSFFIKLNNFKNPDYSFDVSEELYFNFYDEDYSVGDVGNWEIHKNYNEKFTILEQNTIIKNTIEKLKRLIEENFKE